jgi:two-component system KDP operon response regulator KdpE
MSEPGQTILHVEDDPQIRRFVRAALEAEGFRVVDADGMKRGLIDAATHKPDLVILDLGLPDGDGVDFIRDLRAWSGMPVIVVSARQNEADKIEALDAGADDYLSKPFGTGELLARTRAQLRRRAQAGNEGQAEVVFGGVHVDLVRRVVTRDGQPVHLTPLEYRLLTFLIANAGKVVTQRQALREVWGPDSADRSHYLRIYIGYLRRKLEADTARPQHIRTESGVGYRFVL